MAATFTTCDCQTFSDIAAAYVDKKLAKEETAAVNEHLVDCAACRETLRCFREVHGVLSLSQLQQTGAATEVCRQDARTTISLLGGMPWWCVSLALHILIIALAGLVTMAIELPRTDDGVIMVTELQQRANVNAEEPKKEDLARDLQSKLDTPATDKNSTESSDIVIPPDILAKAEIGDHFETINPDRPDTHSAYGCEDAKSFHSVTGSAEPAGGGGMGGLGMEDVIGVGGAASKGKGGGFGGGDGTGIGTGTGAGTGSFGQRNGGGRKLMVRRMGGSPATENAVDAGLDWLARHQEPDGHWLPSKYSGGTGEGTCETGATGLALLAFVGAGHTEKIGKYKDNVQRAVAWFIKNQAKTGCYQCPTDPYGGRFYGHAIATMAMAEEAAMCRNPETRASAQKGVDYISEIQIKNDAEGYDRAGWDYSYKIPGVDTDTSLSSWMTLALKSAKIGGFNTDHRCFEGILKWLDATQPADPYKIGCEYRNTLAGAKQLDLANKPQLHFNNQVAKEHALLAASTVMRLYLGTPKDDPRIQTVAEHLLQKVPEWKANKGMCFYHIYYGTLCEFQAGGDCWKKWNKALKEALVPNQCKGGDDDGSWDPGVDWIGQYGGRVYTTAMATLSLEIYYRYLQLQPDK